MADGDFDVRELGRSRLPGGGSTLAGQAKNDKIAVWGQIDFTYNTAGLVVGAVDLGLSTMDFITVSQVFLNDTAPSATNPASGIYTATSEGNGNIILVTNNTTQAEATDSQNGTLTYFAIGSAVTADLT